MPLCCRRLPLLGFPAVACVLVLTGLTLSGAVNAQSPLPGIVPHTLPVPKANAESTGLSADVFYRLLLGDVALQRGEPSLAARAYYEAARDTRDPRIARRATEIALAARMRGLAQESASLWSSIDPTAERPQQVLAALAAGDTGKIAQDGGAAGELKQKLEKLIADAAVTDRGAGEIFLQLNRFFGDAQDRRQVYELVRELARPYTTTPEAHFAVSLAAFNGGVPESSGDNTALVEVERALALKPDWERAALLRAEIVSRKAPAEAADYLAGFIGANSDAKAAASMLAQIYVEQKRYAEARAVFQKLWDRDRDSREYEFGVAVISVQMKDWDTAEALLFDLKRANYGENGAVELYLAQVAEETGRYDVAIERYKEVPEGARAWLARLRVASMMAKQGKIVEARRYLDDLPAVTIEQRVQVRQAEAQLLRDAGDNAAAYDVLAQALREHPDSPELLYDAAMVAERMDRIDEAETRLRRVVELRPDDAQALNGLGYTLVDRTARATEGYELIQKAHKLSPDDPFILDSMGWALFRMGRFQEAEAYLIRSFKIRPDPEVAAHLGEVIWAQGERVRAQEVWQTQLKITPDNVLLLETVRRLAR